MFFHYEPGQRIALKGQWEGYPATILKVTDEIIIIQFDDLNDTTTILLENMKKLQLNGEVEMIKSD